MNTLGVPSKISIETYPFRLSNVELIGILDKSEGSDVNTVGRAVNGR